MTDSSKSPLQQIMEDQTADRLDYLRARALAYADPLEMDTLQSVVENLTETYKTSRASDVRTHAARAAGVGLWMMQRFAEAIEMLSSIADDKVGAYFLGLCLVETGAYDQAVKAFAKAASAGQDEFICNMGAVDALRRAGKMAEAQERIKAAQSANDSQAELHYQRGCILEAQQQNEEAINEYERAVELDQQHPGALFHLAFWSDLRGHDDVALDCYEKAAALHPVNKGVLMNLGVLYEDRGDYQKAVDTFDRLLSADPTNSRARLYRTDAASSLNMGYDEALERRQRSTAALLRTSLGEFELSARCRGILEKMNLRTLGDLARLSEDEIDASQTFGETTLAELRELLKSKGLHFGMHVALEEAPAAAPVPGDTAGMMAKNIADMDFSIRAQKCMRMLNVSTVSDLVQKSEKELLACSNFGQTSLNEVKLKLAALGLSLKLTEPEEA